MRALTRGIEWMLVAMFGLMALLVFGNVVLRYGFNSGIVFSEEVSRFLFMWLTLVGAVVVLKEQGHLGMDSVVSRFGERGQRACRFIADLLVAGACALLAHGAWRQVVMGMDERAPVTGIPLGYVHAALLVASVGMLVLQLASLWRQVSGALPAGEVLPPARHAVE